MVHKLKALVAIGTLAGVWGNLYILKDNNKM